MSAAPHIRRATLADLPALVALEQGAFATDRLSPRQLRRHLKSSSALFLVAGEKAAVLGNALAFFRRGSEVARLYSIAVADTARGRGVGAALLAAIERDARARGCVQLRLEVRRDNAVAIALYESHGYRRCGFIQGYYDDHMDAWRYAKRLSALDAVNPPQAGYAG